MNNAPAVLPPAFPSTAGQSQGPVANGATAGDPQSTFAAALHHADARPEGDSTVSKHAKGGRSGRNLPAPGKRPPPTPPAVPQAIPTTTPDFAVGATTLSATPASAGGEAAPVWLSMKRNVVVPCRGKTPGGGPSGIVGDEARERHVQSHRHVAATNVETDAADADLLLVSDDPANRLCVTEMPVRTDDTGDGIADFHATAHLREGGFRVVADHGQRTDQR